MKFTSLINSFKTGLTHKLFRGRSDIEALNNSCEELTNFVVLNNGGACRRIGSKDVAFSKNLASVISYRETLALPSYGKQMYKLSIQGSEYIALFDFNKYFTDHSNKTYLGDTSDFLRLFQVTSTVLQDEVEEQKVYNFANPTYGILSGYGTVGGIEYLNDSFKETYNPSYRFQVAQLSSKTILFSHQSGQPFILTLIPFEESGVLVNKFVLIPWVVSRNILIENWSQYISSSANTYIPINAHAHPWLTPNFTSYRMYIVDTPLVAGAEPTEGTRFKKSEGYIRLVYINKKLLPQEAQNDYLNRFIKYTTQNAKEGVYYLTKYYDSQTHGGETYWGFVGIGCVGGLAQIADAGFPAGASRYTISFSLSAWSKQLGYPKAVNTFNSRVFFANTNTDQNKIWVNSPNSQNLSEFQNMSQEVLDQDNASDVSGTKYFDSTLISNLAFEIGLAECVSGSIQWMKSRSKFHIGTTEGEHQIAFKDGAVTSATYYTAKVGTDWSYYLQPVEGERNIYYVTNDGYSVRALNSSDKNYDSQEEDLSIMLYRFPSKIKSMFWCESIKSICLQLFSGDVYTICTDTTGKVFAIVQLSFSEIGEICAGKTDLHIMTTSAVSGTEFKFHRVYFKGNWLDSAGSFLDNSKNLNDITLDDYFENYRGQTLTAIKITNLGVATKYSFIVPIGYNAGDSLSFLGFSYVGTDTVYVGKTYKSRLVTFPIEKGDNFGESRGDIKRIDRATALLYNSGSCKMGVDSTLYDVEGLSLYPYVTDNKKMDFPDSPDTIVQAIIETEEPVALNISGISFRGVTYTGE